ncbi:hypothetical protein [Rhodovulum steppense]|uniref:Uncharacterized protein n=1 Tax=Rhodovulum steppense TaxID=540251 RepID=A0A4R1YW88_9RHOB|nr:hypothetical protein [Rhodovulum steppense]TCM85023.1 hypothetical protein EV216_109108 [Rhodovulum steppense]
MADRIARVARERSLKTLAQRLFVIEEPDAERKLQLAEAALLRANPELATPEGFASGKAIVIPGDIGLPRTDRVIAARADAGGILDETGTRLELAGRVLSDRFAASGKATERGLARLGDRAFAQQVRRALPESAELASKAREALAKRQEEDKSRAERFAKALDEAQERLAALRALAERQR